MLKLEQDRHNAELAAMKERQQTDLDYKKSQADIENQRKLQQLARMRDQKAIEYKTFSNMKAIERQEREHTMRLIQTEKSLVDSQNALGRTAIKAAETQLLYKQAELGGSSARPALMDVLTGRGNLYFGN